MFELLQYFWHGQAHNETAKQFSEMNLIADDKLILETRLPTLVAHGDESSGKSTLLANMIQFDMFDIGKDMITRMVWVYRLRYRAAQTVPLIVVKVHTHPELQTTDPVAVRNLIQEVHNEIKKSGAAIRDQEGYIEIYSNTVPQMDIYDLPGSVALKNKDEPATLAETSRRIARKYLMRPNNIVLHVQSSVVPLRGSVAAGLLDELGCENKITVFTKVDAAVHPHTGLRDFLDMFVRHDDNAIAVSNFQQYPEMSFNDVREEEHKFFKNHVPPQMEQQYKHRFGIPALLQRINVIAERMDGEKWAKVQHDAQQEKLAGLQTQLKLMGPIFSTHELCAIIAESIVGPNSYFEQIMSETWEEQKYSFPLKLNVWTNIGDVNRMADSSIDANSFLSSMNLKIINRLNHLFEFSPLMLHRFEKFRTDYCRKLTTRLSSQSDAFRQKWSELSKFLSNEYLTGSPAYSSERWKHSMYACYVNMVLMKLNDADDQEDGLKPFFIHMSSFQQAQIQTTLQHQNNTNDEREVGPPPSTNLRSMFENLGSELSCEESQSAQNYRLNTQRQIDFLTENIVKLKKIHPRLEHP